MADSQRWNSAKASSRSRATLSRRFWKQLRVASYPISAVLVVLAVWQLGVMVFNVPHYILPTPLAIARDGIRSGYMIAPHFWITLYEALVGLAFAILLAVPFTLLVAYSPFMYRSFYPLLVFFDEVPKVAIAPLLVTWFGFGLQPKMILAFIICFFPIFINGVVGFKSISPDLLNLGRCTGAHEWEMFWKIRLPNALPNLFVGLKMAGSGAMVGAVVAEFLAAERGLGFFLQKAASFMRTELGFATIAAMWTIGLALFFGISLIESLTIPWHVSKRGGPQGQLE
jgi:NitT/TauT family transport system permease protein